MSNWSELARQYLSLAAPYVVPPLALLFATFLFKFILSNKKTRQYARLLMSVMQNQLEEAFGEEKSKQILELWNDLVKETEETPNGKSKAYSEAYFVARMKKSTQMSDEEAAKFKEILAILDKNRRNNVSAASEDENYRLPVLPCICEL